MASYSLINKLNPEDDRIPLFKSQIEQRGFDDTELWNLDLTILKFILPRLKRFREVVPTYPSNLPNHEVWERILNQMIKGFELENSFSFEKKAKNSFDVSCKLFCMYFFDLWW